MRKVKDMISLGKRFASKPSIHIGLQEGGKVSSFVQKSTGEIVENKIDPFFKVRSGLKLWEDKSV